MSILTIVKKTGFNFIRHYLPYFPPGSEIAFNKAQAFTFLPKHKIVLFEWANDLTAQIINSSQFKQQQIRLNFKTVVRIHDHEVRKVFGNTRRIHHINWDRVDAVWFINPLIRDQFHTYIKTPVKSFFIPNAVDPILFPENRATGKKIGFCSIYFRKRKRFDRVVEIAKLIPDWSFHIRTEIPGRNSPLEFRGEYEKFLKLSKGLNNIFIEHRDAEMMIQTQYDQTDLVQWYKDKSVILSTSDWEGYHYAIAEGMASGCMPVVWNWPGAETFWKPFIVENEKQAADQIKKYNSSDKYRKYVLNEYHPEKLIEQALNKI